MVGLIMGVTTLINIVLIPAIAGIFGGWLLGGFDLGGIAEKLAGIVTGLF
jgi:hypothetical protein